jgi:hypothetical protein
VICNEKEHTISELKEKVVVLNSGMRQLETQLMDLRSQNTQVKILPDLYCANLMTPKYKMIVYYDCGCDRALANTF